MRAAPVDGRWCRLTKTHLRVEEYDVTSDRELAAVLTALAGVRAGQAVAVLGGGEVLRRALLAGAGEPVESSDGRVDVAVAVAAHDVPAAVAALTPGGRLVAVAADAGAAHRTAALHGVVLQHVAPVGPRVAWSGRTPTSST